MFALVVAFWLWIVWEDTQFWGRNISKDKMLETRVLYSNIHIQTKSSWLFPAVNFIFISCHFEFLILYWLQIIPKKRSYAQLPNVLNCNIAFIVNIKFLMNCKHNLQQVFDFDGDHVLVNQEKIYLRLKWWLANSFFLPFINFQINIMFNVMWRGMI